MPMALASFKTLSRRASKRDKATAKVKAMINASNPRIEPSSVETLPRFLIGRARQTSANLDCSRKNENTDDKNVK